MKKETSKPLPFPALLGVLGPCWDAAVSGKAACSHTYPQTTRPCSSRGGPVSGEGGPKAPAGLWNQLTLLLPLFHGSDVRGWQQPAYTSTST